MLEFPGGTRGQGSLTNAGSSVPDPGTSACHRSKCFNILPTFEVTHSVCPSRIGLFFFFFFHLLGAIPVAYGGSQARRSNWSCSCRPTPQQCQIQAMSATYTAAHGGAYITSQIPETDFQIEASLHLYLYELLLSFRK